MADDPATKPKEQTKLMDQKEGKGSDDSPTELSSPFKISETTDLDLSLQRRRSLLEISELRDQELDLQRRRSLLELMEQKEGKGSDDSHTELSSPFKLIEQKAGGERSGDSTTKLAGPSKISKTEDQESSGYGSTDWEMSDLRRSPTSSGFISETTNLDLSLQRRRSLLEISELRDQELDSQRRMSLLELMEQKEGKGSDDSPTELSSPFKSMEEKVGERYHKASTTKLAGQSKSKELEGVLLHTQRLTVCDSYQYTPFRLGREGRPQKSGRNTVMRGDAGLTLYVVEWKSTDDKTHLVLWDHDHADHFQNVISILAPLCPAVKHFSIDFYMIHSLQSTHIPTPMPMKSVITVCLKSWHCYETLHEALLAVSNFFPNAESLDAQMENLHSPSDQAYFPEVNSSSSLRKLTLRCNDRYSYHGTTDSLLMDISTSCPNIVSLVLLGFGRCLTNKSGKDITSCKMPHLTNIHLEPFETDDCYRFETFMYVLHVFPVRSPCLRFVEAKKVLLGDAELTSVKWSHCDTSSGWELQFKGASAAVPMTELVHLVSSKLKGVTVLTFDRCNVDFPQSVSHPLQKENSVRELKFLNLESPLSQTDMHKLSEMYPNVKVTVEYKSQASHEDSEQGTGIPFKPERKTFPSSSPSATSSIDELIGATARVQVHEEQTKNQNTKEEEDHIAIASLAHETDEVNVKPIKMECCKRVGVEGGRLQLDSFGIKLEIPPGAIDSEVPQDISLRVLTDTQNLGNSKEEMSVCFGVQCLAPDDLVLKLPVTYIIPHCAVITRYSSVEAVLYTGEGEYSPDAEVKEQIPLTQSGIPNCNIERDVLRLQMNHFSWAFIKFKLKNFFFRGKRMCCMPFAEKPLPEERTHVILRAHLYDDIEGINMKIASQEKGVGFASISPEVEVLISVAEVDVEMTCFIDSDPIKYETVKYGDLRRGHKRTRFFILDLSSHTDEEVLVILQVGQTGQTLEKLLCKFNFTTPRSTSLPTHGQEQAASSLHKLQTSRQSTGETPENISGRQEDFDEKLTTVARKVGRRDEIDKLGKALGFDPEDIQRYVDTNMKNSEVSYMGTLLMLRYWRKKQTEATECEALKGVLKKAGQQHLAFELFGT